MMNSVIEFLVMEHHLSEQGLKLLRQDGDSKTLRCCTKDDRLSVVLTPFGFTQTRVQDERSRVFKARVEAQAPDLILQRLPDIALPRSSTSQFLLCKLAVHLRDLPDGRYILEDNRPRIVHRRSYVLSMMLENQKKVEVFDVPLDDPRRLLHDDNKVFRGVRALENLDFDVPICTYDGHNHHGHEVATVNLMNNPDFLRYKIGPLRLSDGDNDNMCCRGNPLGYSPGPLVNACRGTDRQANCGYACVVPKRNGRVLGVQWMVVSTRKIAKGEELLAEYQV